MEKKINRHISKKDLLETLIKQQKRIEELETELEKANKKIQSRKILIEEAGSIAKAALELNNIFETAQKAADDYVDNVKNRCKKLETTTKNECKKMTEDAKKLLDEAKFKKEKNNTSKTKKKSTSSKKVSKK